MWDGFCVDGVGSTLEGLGSLVGFADWHFSWETFTSSWERASALFGNDGHGTWSWSTAGDAWKGLLAGVISLDQWQEGNPGRALGGGTFSVASMAIPWLVPRARVGTRRSRGPEPHR